MKVSTENDNNFGFEKITILGDNMPLKSGIKMRFLDPFTSSDPNTHKLYILGHCINIVFILQKYHINPSTVII
jgi:hypothetical protein